jgi:hypothetical protein
MRSKKGSIKLVFENIHARDKQLAAFKWSTYRIDSNNPLIVWVI